MADWVDVCREIELTENSPKIVDIDDVMILVVRVNDAIYAIEDVCTHDGAEISTGVIHNDCIECPRHGAKFNLATGKVLSAPAYEDIPVFPIRVHNDIVQVMDDRWD